MVTVKDDINYFLNRKAINIDIGFRCSLECPKCQRQTQHRNLGLKVPGYDITIDEILKLADFYKSFVFCGQLSDPIHHPQFEKILRLLFLKRIDCQVHNASSHKPEKAFIKCFKANPEARWVFGIDGLPKDSHKYRINQDGEKLFRMMLEAKKILKRPPVWQYLVFRYNEDNVAEAKALADKNGLPIMIVQSSRWKGDDDYLKPKEGLNAL